jgi:predicted nuclease with TOPRIM domain
MVAGLEDIVKELTKTKDEQFHTIQARQSEAETARSESETLQNRTKELEFQLREANERIALLEEASTSSARPAGRGRTNGFLDSDRHTASPSPSPARSRRNSVSLSGPSPAEVQRIVADAEARAEAKLNDMRSRIRALEKERNDLEEEWGTKLQERVRELEGLKRRIHEKESEYDESLSKVREVEGRVGEGVEQRKRLEKEIQGLKDKVEEMAEDVATAQESEVSHLASRAMWSMRTG